MELGAGVHGEAGIAKMKMGTAKEIVTMIIDKVQQLGMSNSTELTDNSNNLPKL